MNVRLGTIGVVAALAAACATATTGRDFDVAAVQRIKIGVTTREDVRRVLGEPTSRNVSDRVAEVWIFSFAVGDVETKALSVALRSDVVAECRLTVRRAGGNAGSGRAAPTEAVSRSGSRRRAPRPNRPPQARATSPQRALSRVW